MKKFYSPLPAELERLAAEIVDACYTVHCEMGPGLLESVYEACLCRELEIRSIPLKRQVPITLTYKSVDLAAKLRLDIVVADSIVLELKCVRTFEPIHTAQLLSYLRLTSKPLGFLLNFHVVNIKHGIRRYVMSNTLATESDAI